MKTGYIFYDKTFAGILTQHDDGTFSFEYDNDYFNDQSAFPISLTMPKTKQLYTSNILFPFFDGLIPEGYLLELALNKYQIERNDRMSILLKTCADPIGIVSVKEEK